MYLDSDDKIAAQEMMARMNMAIAIALELGIPRDIRKILNEKCTSFLYVEEP
jgi:hypothetical protein